ncbi:MAG: hypothetical protein ACFB20_13275 [Opitutales bacterium]
MRGRLNILEHADSVELVLPPSPVLGGSLLVGVGLPALGVFVSAAFGHVGFMQINFELAGGPLLVLALAGFLAGSAVLALGFYLMTRRTVLRVSPRRVTIERQSLRSQTVERFEHAELACIQLQITERKPKKPARGQLRLMPVSGEPTVLFAGHASSDLEAFLWAIGSFKLPTRTTDLTKGDGKTAP